MASPWTIGTARLVSVGGICVSDGKKEIKDVYAVILAAGTRPAPGNNGIPDYGDDHPTVDGFTVSNISFEQPDPTSVVWNATVTYSHGASSGSDPDDHSKYTRLRIGAVSESRELTEDAEDATPVLNAAGDPFESVPMVERLLTEIQITRNQDSSPAEDIVSLNGTVNSSAVTVCGVSIPARCGRITIEADRQFSGESKWSVSFRIVVNPDTWSFKILQNGYRYIPLSGAAAVKFTSVTDDGRVAECSTPQLLKPDGGDGRGGPAYYAAFAAYRSASWTSLKLPSSI